MQHKKTIINNNFGFWNAECESHKSKIKNPKSKIRIWCKKNSFLLLVCICLSLPGFYNIGDARAAHFTLTVAHVNDTHGHLQPVPLKLLINNEAVYMDAGGFPRLAAKINELRAEHQNFLFLHAGDVFQGTLFFTEYQGQADVVLLNSMQLDALCPGNHEFDKGVETLAAFLRQASFPVVAANIKAPLEPVLHEKIKPWVIKQFGRERVGIIGLATPDTAFISNPGPQVQFFDQVAAAQQSIAELTGQGINKIIVLSHLGFDRDIALARAVDGIDLIAGGHTHTLLGSFKGLGLEPEAGYPYAVKTGSGETVLIVQSWEWGKVLGILKIEFNEGGQVAGYSGGPVILTGEKAVRKKQGGTLQRADEAMLKKAGIEIVEEDKTIADIVRKYAGPIDKLYGKVIATAEDDLPHVRRPDIRSPSGRAPELSQIAPLVADSMLWKARQGKLDAQIAVLNGGSIIKGLPSGNISAGQAFDLLPYSNHLVMLELTGREIKKALSSGVARACVRRGRGGMFPYVGGLRYAIRKKQGRVAGIAGLTVQTTDGQWLPLDDRKTYRVIMNEYIARGGDGYTVFAQAKGMRYDTGYIDTEVFQDYARFLGTLRRPAEQYITFIDEGK